METAKLSRFVSDLARRLSLRKGLNIVLVSDQAMLRLNRRFAGKRRPTDVLSFPDRPEEWENPEEASAGDVFISVETADRQRRGSLLEELQTLSLHGVLHLIGYDHETDQGEMASLESELRREFRLR